MTINEWLNDDELGISIWKNKYQYNNETLDEWFDRVSGGDQELRELIVQKKFLFGGRILANRGLDKVGKKVTYSNCYVIAPPEDNLESIFECGAKLARTFSYGGGCGIDISKLRPVGASVNNAAKTTSGSTSFMDFYSYITGLIGQSGRRGALMISISDTHPDLEEFISIKSDLDKVTKANVSVRISDQFMEAVQEGKNVKLSFTAETGEVIEKEVDSRKIFRKLCEMNWDYAEPGILFWDKICNWNLLSNNPEFEYAGLNPCAEEPLPAGGSCLLGSLNISEFVVNDKFHWEDFGRAVKIAVNALNNVLDEGLELHPLKEQRESVRNWRQIGLGMFGLADALIKLKVRYGSNDAINFVNRLTKIMMEYALWESTLLAKQFGSYPKYTSSVLTTPFIENLFSKIEFIDRNDLKRHILEYGLRNSQLLTIPPAGSIATMLGVSTGAEPIFATSYTRTTKSLENKDKDFKVYTPIIKKFIDEGYSENNLPEYIVTSENIPHNERIYMQAALQEFIDASISSTLNISKSATIEDVESIYNLAWKSGLKGATIFRQGCKRTAILNVEDKVKKPVVSKRPESLKCKLVRFKNGNESWIAFIGLLNNKPYEIFTGVNDLDQFPVPIGIEEGEIIKVKTDTEKRYDFKYIDKYGYVNRLGGLSRIFNQEYWNYAKLISALLRHETPIDKVVKIVNGMHFESDTLNSWKNGIKRALKSFVEDGTISEERCPECGEKLVYSGGCVECKFCGHSKCS